MADDGGSHERLMNLLWMIIGALLVLLLLSLLLVFLLYRALRHAVRRGHTRGASVEDEDGNEELTTGLLSERPAARRCSGCVVSLLHSFLIPQDESRPPAIAAAETAVLPQPRQASEKPTEVRRGPPRSTRCSVNETEEGESAAPPKPLLPPPQGVLPALRPLQDYGATAMAVDAVPPVHAAKRSTEMRAPTGGGGEDTYIPSTPKDRVVYNTTLDSHYRLIRRIGEGAFASVYLVQRKQTGKMYALKYVACKDERARQAALRECELMHTLQRHPNVIQIVDMFMSFQFHHHRNGGGGGVALSHSHSATATPLVRASPLLRRGVNGDAVMGIRLPAAARAVPALQSLGEAAVKEGRTDGRAGESRVFSATVEGPQVPPHDIATAAAATGEKASSGGMAAPGCAAESDAGGQGRQRPEAAAKCSASSGGPPRVTIATGMGQSGKNEEEVDEGSPIPKAKEEGAASPPLPTSSPCRTAATTTTSTDLSSGSMEEPIQPIFYRVPPPPPCQEQPLHHGYSSGSGASRTAAAAVQANSTVSIHYNNFNAQVRGQRQALYENPYLERARGGEVVPPPRTSYAPGGGMRYNGLLDRPVAPRTSYAPLAAHPGGPGGTEGGSGTGVSESVSEAIHAARVSQQEHRLQTVTGVSQCQPSATTSSAPPSPAAPPPSVSYAPQKPTYVNFMVGPSPAAMPYGQRTYESNVAWQRRSSPAAASPTSSGATPALSYPTHTTLAVPPEEMSSITTQSSSCSVGAAEQYDTNYLCLVMEYHEAGDLASYIQRCIRFEEEEEARLRRRASRSCMTASTGSGAGEDPHKAATAVISAITATTAPTYFNPLTEAQLLSIAYQLASALHFMHHQNPPIIHRDLKPENILIKGDAAALGLPPFTEPSPTSQTPPVYSPTSPLSGQRYGSGQGTNSSGQSMRAASTPAASDAEGPSSSSPMIRRNIIPVLITDFGLAVLEKSQRRTNGRGGGTRPYIAPEAWEGKTSVASDMWSFGCVLYALATSRTTKSTVPMMSEEATRDGFASRIMKDLQARRYSLALASFIVSMLVVDPAKRPTAEMAMQCFLVRETDIIFDLDSPFFSNVLDL